MNFANAMKKQLNQRKSITENGAVAYETSGNSLLDFNFAITALRNAPYNKVQEMFSRAFYENPKVAVKYLFWLRDPRGGNGERKIYYDCMRWLANVRPEYVQAVVPLMPEYGRFDDWWQLLSSPAKDDVLAEVKAQLEEDEKSYKKTGRVSLLAKWMCSSNASSSTTRYYAHIINTSLGMTERNYRKMLTKYRKALDLVEVKMSANEWNKINYSAVPSRANLIYKDAFMRHDRERRVEYLESLKKGEAKINAGVLQPHEIVRKYNLASTDETLESLWKALSDEVIDNTLVVRDGSASMLDPYQTGVGVRPLDVATALSIYMAEHNRESWKGKFITFSKTPKFVDISNANSLREKLLICNRETECSNTNIEATMMLVLETAIDNNISQAEMPKRIVIVSDMQFDRCVGVNESHLLKGPTKADFERIADKFKEHGYLMPKIVFWNVSGKVNNTIPMQENELGVILYSGFSTQLLHMVMSGKTDPYEALLETINVPRYAPIDLALNNVGI